MLVCFRFEKGSCDLRSIARSWGNKGDVTLLVGADVIFATLLCGGKAIFNLAATCDICRLI